MISAHSGADTSSSYGDALPYPENAATLVAQQVRNVDAILVTHSHVDHLNRWSLKALDRDTHLVVPKGCKDIVSDLGFAKVTEVTAG